MCVRARGVCARVNRRVRKRTTRAWTLHERIRALLHAAAARRTAARLSFVLACIFMYRVARAMCARRLGRACMCKPKRVKACMPPACICVCGDGGTQSAHERHSHAGQCTACAATKQMDHSGTSHSTRHAVHERATTRACRPACLRSVGSTFLPRTSVSIGWQHFMDGMRTLHCMAGMYQRAPCHTHALRYTSPLCAAHSTYEQSACCQEPPFKPHLVSVHALQVPSLLAGMGHIPK